MKRGISGIWQWLAMALGGATLFQAYPITGVGGAGGYGCQRFATNGLANSIDFSYLLDFQNGFFGGVVDPCGDLSSGPLFLDCEGAVRGPAAAADETGVTGTSTTVEEEADQTAGGG